MQSSRRSGRPCGHIDMSEQPMGETLRSGADERVAAWRAASDKYYNAKSDDAKKSAAMDYAYARARPKLPHQLTTLESWLMAVVFIAAYVCSLQLFGDDLSRINPDGPAHFLIGLTMFAGAVAAVAVVRQWILNRRG